MDIKDLSEEFIASAKGCKDLDELNKLAREANVELSDDVLQAFSGGGDRSTLCPEDTDCHP